MPSLRNFCTVEHYINVPRLIMVIDKGLCCVFKYTKIMGWGGLVPCSVAWQRACINTSSLSLKCYLFWYMLWLTLAPLWPRIRTCMYARILVVRPRWWAVEDAQIITGKRAWIWHALGKWWICIYAQGFIWQACCHNIVCLWCCIHAYTNYPLGRCYRCVWGVEVSTCKGSCQPRIHCI